MELVTHLLIPGCRRKSARTFHVLFLTRCLVWNQLISITFNCQYFLHCAQYSDSRLFLFSFFSFLYCPPSVSALNTTEEFIADKLMRDTLYGIPPVPDKRGTCGNKSDSTQKSAIPITTVIAKRPTKFFPVKNRPQLFFIDKDNELPFSCNVCKVGTKLPTVLNNHLSCEKNFVNLALHHSIRPTFRPHCHFCNNYFSLHNFKSHLSGSN